MKKYLISSFFFFDFINKNLKFIFRIQISLIHFALNLNHYINLLFIFQLFYVKIMTNQLVKMIIYILF